jgi:hypothetical protein
VVGDGQQWQRDGDSDDGGEKGQSLGHGAESYGREKTAAAIDG